MVMSLDCWQVNSGCERTIMLEIRVLILQSMESDCTHSIKTGNLCKFRTVYIIQSTDMCWEYKNVLRLVTQCSRSCIPPLCKFCSYELCGTTYYLTVADVSVQVRYSYPAIIWLRMATVYSQVAAYATWSIHGTALVHLMGLYQDVSVYTIVVLFTYASVSLTLKKLETCFLDNK